ncbi:MAG: pilus assembly protein HicB [Paracoccaceae bacterium]
MSVHAKARVSLNLPQSLKAAAEDFAEREGVSLNQFIALALAEKVGAARAADYFTERGKGADAARAVAWLEGRAG